MKEGKEVLPFVIPYECVKCKKRYVIAIPLERLEKQGQGLVSKSLIEELKSPSTKKFVLEMKARIPGWEAKGWTFVNVGVREALQCEKCGHVIDMDKTIREMSEMVRKREAK